MEASESQELQLDVSHDILARTLHRVVRAMHDGHCPKCAFRAPPERFNLTLDWHTPGGYKCPSCGFAISAEAAQRALLAFQPIFKKGVELFEAWVEKGCPVEGIDELFSPFQVQGAYQGGAVPRSVPVTKNPVVQHLPAPHPAE